GDVKIVVKDKQGTKLAEFPAMVRVRKSADTLTAGERDRFLKAFAVLNAGGAGVFQSFRDTHTLATAAQAHGNAAFLPWHRAFLLDLERELQRVQPSVALPYWRFDVPARKMFTADFIGAQDLNTETAKFSPNNPLGQWSTDGRPGIDRLADFDTRTGHAAVIGEQTVVTFAGPFARLPRPFESNPHGQAHTSFFGFLRDLEMAARDPLFYLLHCNVDRLWAKWQWINQRMQPSGAANFGFEDNGTAVPEGQRPPGHNLADEMWPWNNVKTAPRPPFAPRHPFPGGVGVSAPAAKPKVRMMIDYQGIHDPAARLGFDYDDVPFQP
ncbi:MAG: tyrosinase, partial [Solirubrobacteraceae bacterium]|nr:tyrosinase [Solirubrobacteraceae bacterium]